MTKQTIEDLIPEIEEKGSWYFHYHDSMSNEAKPGAPDVGNYHPYVQSFHNYPKSGTQTFEHSSNESDGRLEFNKNYGGDQDKAYMNQILGKERFELLDINHDGIIDAKDDLNKDNQIDDKDRELYKEGKKDKK